MKELSINVIFKTADCERLGEGESFNSPKTPTPHNQAKEGWKEKQLEDRKIEERLSQQDSIGTALKSVIFII